MFLVEIEAVVGMGRRLSDDDITDLMEAIVDDLDDLTLEPSVGTCRVGDDVKFTVGVVVDREEEFDALSDGVSAVKAAFHSAGIGTARLFVPRELHSRVLAQPA